MGKTNAKQLGQTVAIAVNTQANQMTALPSCFKPRALPAVKYFCSRDPSPDYLSIIRAAVACDRIPDASRCDANPLCPLVTCSLLSRPETMIIIPSWRVGLSWFYISVTSGLQYFKCAWTNNCAQHGTRVGQATRMNENTCYDIQTLRHDRQLSCGLALNKPLPKKVVEPPFHQHVMLIAISLITTGLRDIDLIHNVYQHHYSQCQIRDRVIMDLEGRGSWTLTIASGVA